MERHPDFEDIRNSDDFHSWAKEQPDSIQAWIYSNADDADLASRALDLFKKDIGIEPSKRQSHLLKDRLENLLQIWFQLKQQVLNQSRKNLVRKGDCCHEHGCRI